MRRCEGMAADVVLLCDGHALMAEGSKVKGSMI
jgi:hypothetical protein